VVDLSAAYRDTKSLPDDVLKKELASPSGLIPGYLIMSELQEREATRAGGMGGDPNNQPSIREEILSSGIAPSNQYSKGGIVAQLNPFNAVAKGMKNPDIMGGYMQEAINKSSGGLPALQAAQAPGALSPPTHLSQFIPTPSGAPQQPGMFANGGLVSLMRR